MVTLKHPWTLLYFSLEYTPQKISPNVYLSELLLLETTPTNQEKTTTPKNYVTVAWDTLSHQKLTMDPTIAVTRKYCDTQAAL